MQQKTGNQNATFATATFTMFLNDMSSWKRELP